MTSWADVLSVAAYDIVAVTMIIVVHIVLFVLIALVLYVCIVCVRRALDNTVWFLRGVREWTKSIWSKWKR